MTTPSHGFPVDDMAEHSAWMRRLAHALVGEAAADDVVQDAWAKLGSRRERPGYLAAVVRSLALRRLRSERRRKLRECRAAKDELPSTADIAARSEIVRRLAVAVEALDEPYRQTIVLRYFDDLSSADIARRSGIPAATVRARLKRGLDQLRASLDRDGGGRERWLGALLPWVGPPGQTPLKASSALAVFVAMKTLLIALLAVGVLVSAWMLFIDTSTPPTGAAATASESGEAAPTRTVDAGADEARSERKLVATGASAAAPEGDPAPAAAVIHARVVDAQRYPLPFAWLWLVGGDRTNGDADGRVRLELEATELERLAAFYNWRTLEFRVGAPGCQTRRVLGVVREGQTNLHLGDVVLEPGGDVQGRVVDATGLGVEGAVVAFGRPSPGVDNEAAMARRGPPDLFVEPGENHNPAVSGTSGPGGLFHLVGVPVGYGVAWARTRTGLWTRSKPISVGAGETVHGIELVVKDTRDRTITGRITDPDGRIVPGLELMWPNDGGWHIGRTDVLGRFYFAPEEAKSWTIVAHSPTTEWLDIRHVGITIGTHDLELSFQRAVWLTVTVKDPDGSAIQNGNVLGISATGTANRTLPRCRSQLDADGVARLRSPSEDLRVLVASPGYRDKLVGPFKLDAFPAPLTVTLERVPALTGRVLMPSGQPAGGAKVSLHRGTSGKRNITHQSWGGDRNAFVYHMNTEPSASVTADEHGAFRMPLPGFDARSPEVQEAPPVFGHPGYSNLKGDAWYVHAATPACATVTSGPHAFDPSSNAKLELSLPVGGTIAGRLLLPPRMLPSGWTIYASDALGELAEATVNADGTYELTNLHAGGWQIRAFEPGMGGPGPGASMLTNRVPIPDVQVEVGKTTHYEYDARPRLNARLVGRVRIDGKPPGALIVHVSTISRDSSITEYQCTLGPQGGFELALPAGMLTTVSFFLPSDGDGFWISGKPTIVDGVNTWNMDLWTTRIKGVFDPGGGKRSSMSYETRGNDWAAIVGWKGEPGRFGPIRVIAGPGVLRGPPPNNVSKGSVLLEVDLAPGTLHDLGTLSR